MILECFAGFVCLLLCALVAFVLAVLCVFWFSGWLWDWLGFWFYLWWYLWGWYKTGFYWFFEFLVVCSFLSLVLWLLIWLFDFRHFWIFGDLRFCLFLLFDFGVLVCVFVYLIWCGWFGVYLIKVLLFNVLVVYISVFRLFCWWLLFGYFVWLRVWLIVLLIKCLTCLVLCFYCLRLIVCFILCWFIVWHCCLFGFTVCGSVLLFWCWLVLLVLAYLVLL